jgi:hypothetical protein
MFVILSAAKELFMQERSFAALRMTESTGAFGQVFSA